MSLDWRYASDDERAIADGAYQLAIGLGGVERARVVRDGRPHTDEKAWASMAQMGWLGMLVPEEHGGLGMPMSDVVVVLENLGRLLVPEPVAQGIVSAGLLAAMDAQGNGDLIDDLVSGARVIVTVTDTATHASVAKRAMWEGDVTPDATVLVASIEDGFVAKAIACDAAGVVLHQHACVDGSSLTEIVVDDAAWRAARQIGHGTSAHAAFVLAGDRMLLCHAALMVGLMHEALQTTLEFMALRRQFGQPIGAFQALQHRAATCHVANASARAVVHEACKSLGSPALLHKAAAIAKAAASESALHVTKECVQFHGAIGFTDEHDIGLYLRRAMTLAARQGNSRVQRARLLA